MFDAPSLPSNVKNGQIVEAQERGNAVRFYDEALPHEFESKKQGRPIFFDAVMIEIICPGGDKNIIRDQARDHHKAKYPIQWQHYLNTRDGSASAIGTPLQHWPLLSRAQVEELRGIKFMTVEMIANASDEQIARVGMIGGKSPLEFRRTAQAWLQAAADTSIVMSQQQEIEQRDLENKALVAQVAELARTVEAMKQAPQAAPQAPRQRRKRGPNKAKAQAQPQTESAQAA